jgi:hypothetical protein
LPGSQIAHHREDLHLPFFPTCSERLVREREILNEDYQPQRPRERDKGVVVRKRRTLVRY